MDCKFLPLPITLAAAAVLALSSGSSHAVQLQVDNPGANQHVVVLEPVTLTALMPGRMRYVIFEDFFASNVGASGVPVGVQEISYTINSGTYTPSVNAFTGTYAGSTLGIDPNDLFFNFGQYANSNPGITVATGESITIGGNHRFAVPTGTIPSLNPNYDGNIRIVEFDGGILAQGTVGVATPETGSTLAMLGLAVVGIARLRRKAA